MQGSWPFPVVVRPLFQFECGAGVQKSFRVKISVIGFARGLKATRKKKRTYAYEEKSSRSTECCYITSVHLELREQKCECKSGNKIPYHYRS